MIVNRHIATIDPYNGLSPDVLNVPAQWVGFPKASASNAVYTTANHFTATNNSIGVSMAPGTQPDYARNVVAKFVPNTASAGLYSAGTLVFHGRDVMGSSRSESFAITAMGSVSAPNAGSINFAKIDSISVTGLRFHTASSSARSDVSLIVGVGQKLGMPISFASTNAIFAVVQGTVQQLQYDGTASTASSNNQWTAVTGDYHIGGLSLSAAHNSASMLQVGYKNLGRQAPTGSY